MEQLSQEVDRRASLIGLKQPDNLSVPRDSKDLRASLMRLSPVQRKVKLMQEAKKKLLSEVLNQ